MKIHAGLMEATMVDHLTDEYRGYYIDLYAPADPQARWRAVVMNQETGEILAADTPLEADDLLAIRCLVESLIDTAADVRDGEAPADPPAPGQHHGAR